MCGPSSAIDRSHFEIQQLRICMIHYVTAPDCKCLRSYTMHMLNYLHLFLSHARRETESPFNQYQMSIFVSRSTNSDEWLLIWTNINQHMLMGIICTMLWCHTNNTETHDMNLALQRKPHTAGICIIPLQSTLLEHISNAMIRCYSYEMCHHRII